MPAYQQCSTRVLMDKTTYDFVPIDKRVEPCKIEVPFYFWTYGEGARTHVTVSNKRFSRQVQSVFCRNNLVELNGTLIQFTQGYRFASVSFYAASINKVLTIDLSASPTYTAIFDDQGERLHVINGMHYGVRIDDRLQKFDTKFGAGNTGDFIGIPTLGQFPGGGKVFSFGLSNETYNVEYRGIVLNGTSLAFIAGPYGVLLNDDLSFDTFVLFKSVKPGNLIVDKFIYTTNPYIVKIMTLY